MVAMQFADCDIRRNLPSVVMKQLCEAYDLCDIWVHKVLDYKEDGDNNIIERATGFIAEYKRLLEIKKAKREASIQSLNFKS